MRSTTKNAVYGPLRLLEKELKRLRTMAAKDEHTEKLIRDLERFKAWRFPKRE